jgi:hypothetical protein
MKAAIDSLVALIRATTAFSGFIGTSGPFWELAPEATDFPFMVLGQVGGSKAVYGFGGGSYIEPLVVQIDLYGVSLETVATNAETVCKTLDFASLTITSEQCRNIRRLEAPRLMTSGINGKAQRVYKAVIQYRLTVQRTVGA